MGSKAATTEHSPEDLKSRPPVLPRVRGSGFLHDPSQPLPQVWTTGVSSQEDPLGRSFNVPHGWEECSGPDLGGTHPRPLGRGGGRAQTGMRRWLLLPEQAGGEGDAGRGPEPSLPPPPLPAPLLLPLAEPAAQLRANGHRQHGPAVFPFCPQHAQDHGPLL